jgi:hypothetical protein
LVRGLAQAIRVLDVGAIRNNQRKEMMMTEDKSAEYDAFNAALEAAAALFDEREKAATALTGKAVNVTEMQLHAGASLRAQLDAKKIRALKKGPVSGQATPRQDVDSTARNRRYGS